MRVLGETRSSWRGRGTAVGAVPVLGALQAHIKGVRPKDPSGSLLTAVTQRELPLPPKAVCFTPSRAGAVVVSPQSPSLSPF